MIYIYSRVSTDVQTVTNQINLLSSLHPSAKVITETISGRAKHKPMLEGLIAALQPGDKVVAFSLDRLGRSLVGIIETIEQIAAKGAQLELYRERVSYDNAMGKLMIQILGAVAELERELTSERTRVALKARKNAGVRLGPPPKISQEQIDSIVKMADEGMSSDAISAVLNIPKTTVYRWRMKNYSTSSLEI